MTDLLLNDIGELLATAELPGIEPRQAGAEYRTLRTRIEHLDAEQAMLRQSHAEALDAAIEEREERLREQEEHTARLQAIMMMAADGIVTIDEQGTIESFNEAACWIFGYAREEVLGKDIALLMPFPYRQYRDEYARHSANSRREGRIGFGREVTGRRKNGQTFPLDLAVSEVCLGERRMFTGVFRDISDRKLAEAQLRQAQKLESIGQLAAGIAHEINTPTQYIGDNARFLQEAFGDLSAVLEACARVRQAAAQGPVPQPLIDALAAAAAAADVEYLLGEIPAAIRQSLEGLEHVGKIVRSMKEFSHPGGEEKQAVDLNRAIESTLTVSRNEWKYVADAATDLDPNLPLVCCLPGDVNQVLLNLIVNAAHAIAEKIGPERSAKGRITIGTRTLGAWAEIRVTDTGTGIRPEIRNKVYDPFFTTKPVGRGTGQGLAIAHTVIVERHGGTIEFESEVGQGTTFILRLPVGPREGKGDSPQSQGKGDSPLFRADVVPANALLAEKGDSPQAEKGDSPREGSPP